jgi:hypothetical protein
MECDSSPQGHKGTQGTFVSLILQFLIMFDYFSCIDIKDPNIYALVWLQRI